MSGSHPHHPLAPGTLVDRYLVEALVSHGGSGAVYRARALDAAPGAREQVALKVTHAALANPGREFGRFQQEARVLARLDHPHIVQVYEFNVFRGCPYIAMEWLEGADLAQVLSTRPPLLPAEALALMEQIGSALAAVHEHQIVHRDLKAENVIALGWPDRMPLTVKVVDFGIAKLLHDADQDHALTTRSIVGTPRVMAPEQFARGTVDQRTDIYALGVLLYEVLTGESPFRGDLAVIQHLHTDGRIPRPGEHQPIARPCDSVVLRAMQKDRRARYASVPDLLSDLRAAVAECTRAAHSHTAESRGIALYAELRGVADEGPEDAQENAREDAREHAQEHDLEEDPLDAVYELYEALGMTLALETFDQVMAFAPLTGDGRERRREIIVAALDLAEQHAGSLDPAAPALCLFVHVGPLQAPSSKHEFYEGDLLRRECWPAEREQTAPNTPAACSVQASAAALTGLDDHVHSRTNFDQQHFIPVRRRPGNPSQRRVDSDGEHI